MTTRLPTGNRRLLIVDDNPAIHDDFHKILAARSETSGLDELEAAVFGEEAAATVEHAPEFELTSGHQGQEALELVKRAVAEGGDFAVAFVDMRMPPGWDGLETIERLWEADPKLQVVICTAYADYSWDEIIRRVGRGDKLLILKKPFDPIEVRQLAITLSTKWNLERAAHAEMESIVETAAEGIVTLREDGKINSCNAAALSMFALEAGGADGRDFASLVTDPGAFRTALAEADSGAVTAREFTGLRGAGEFPMLVGLSKYDTPDGRRYTAILRDLSEYKQMQQRLTRAQRLESVGQLAAGVAHEINTPLQYSSQNLEFVSEALEQLSAVVNAYEASLDMSGEARSWQERFDELTTLSKASHLAEIRDDLPNAIGESIDGLQCVARIVKAMRDLTHPGSGAGEYADADLNEIVESAIKLSRNRWKEYATLETDLYEGDASIECQSQDLVRVVINLLTNAADAVTQHSEGPDPTAATITVRTRPSDDGMELVVEDTGPGMPPEVARRVFDPFFTTKEVGKGTGQGMAISHEIVVTGHHGAIDCQSTPGEGATFSVRLPRRQPRETDAAAPQPEMATAVVD